MELQTQVLTPEECSVLVEFVRKEVLSHYRGQNPNNEFVGGKTAQDIFCVDPKPYTAGFQYHLICRGTYLNDQVCVIISTDAEETSKLMGWISDDPYFKQPCFMEVKHSGTVWHKRKIRLLFIITEPFLDQTYRSFIEGLADNLTGPSSIVISTVFNVFSRLLLKTQDTGPDIFVVGEENGYFKFARERLVEDNETPNFRITFATEILEIFVGRNFNWDLQLLIEFIEKDFREPYFKDNSLLSQILSIHPLIMSDDWIRIFVKENVDRVRAAIYQNKYPLISLPSKLNSWLRREHKRVPAGIDRTIPHYNESTRIVWEKLLTEYYDGSIKTAPGKCAGEFKKRKQDNKDGDMTIYMRKEYHRDFKATRPKLQTEKPNRPTSGGKLSLTENAWLGNDQAAYNDWEQWCYLPHEFYVHDQAAYNEWGQWYYQPQQYYVQDQALGTAATFGHGNGHWEQWHYDQPGSHYVLGQNFGSSAAYEHGNGYWPPWQYPSEPSSSYAQYEAYGQGAANMHRNNDGTSVASSSHATASNVQSKLPQDLTKLATEPKETINGNWQDDDAFNFLTIMRNTYGHRIQNKIHLSDGEMTTTIHNIYPHLLATFYYNLLAVGELAYPSKDDKRILPLKRKTTDDAFEEYLPLKRKTLVTQVAALEVGSTVIPEPTRTVIPEPHIAAPEEVGSTVLLELHATSKSEGNTSPVPAVQYDSVEDFLKSIGLEEYTNAFKQHYGIDKVDISVLEGISDEAFAYLEIPEGARETIRKALKAMRKSAALLS